MIRAKVVATNDRLRGGIKAVPLPDSNCAWSSIGISDAAAQKLKLRIGELIDCEVNDTNGLAYLVIRAIDGRGYDFRSAAPKYIAPNQDSGDASAPE
jgi:hypothetical protein